MSNKKNRGPNFTRSEKATLLSLVSQYKNVVENKKTDAVTTALKNEGWEKIAQEFNSVCSFCVRTSDQLKTCWENLKRSTRKEKASTERETFLSGGGSPDQSSTGPLLGQVEAILGPTLDGLQNQFDSDALYSQDNELSEVKPMEYSIGTAGPSVSQDECSTFVSEKENNGWNGWSQAAFKAEVSGNLDTTKKKFIMSTNRVQRRRPKSKPKTIQDELLENKLELVQIAKKNLESETKLKFEILQEQLKQEKLKTELLQLQLDALKK